MEEWSQHKQEYYETPRKKGRIGLKKKVKNKSVEESNQELAKAWKKFNRSKEKFPEWRQQHNESLIEAIVEEKQFPKKNIKAIMKREEVSRQLGEKAKRNRGKGKKEPILRVVIKDRNGIEKELNTQSLVVSAIAASNKKRQQQYEGTPFILPPLVNEFRFLENKEFVDQVMKGTYEAPPNICPYAIEVLKELKMLDAIK